MHLPPLSQMCVRVQHWHVEILQFFRPWAHPTHPLTESVMVGSFSKSKKQAQHKFDTEHHLAPSLRIRDDTEHHLAPSLRIRDDNEHHLAPSLWIRDNTEHHLAPSLRIREAIFLVPLHDLNGGNRDFTFYLQKTILECYINPFTPQLHARGTPNKDENLNGYHYSAWQ